MAETTKIDWMKKLAKMPGAVTGDYDPFAHTLSFGTPSVDFIFGKTWGLPLGYTAILWGPSKGGKSLLANSLIGQLHKDDPTAFAVKFNTEMREEGQLGKKNQEMWGIDPNRYMAFDTNAPDEVFDKIENDINAMCQEGLNLKLIIIDSITDVVGRRAMNDNTVMTQQRGDDALTIQEGLKRIRKVIRRNRIALVLTAHARAEQDPLEIMRGNVLKMAGANYLKHFSEYFIFVAPNKSKDGKTDLSGNKLVNDEYADTQETSERIGHKIRATMKESSVGVIGRTAEFTLNYTKGIVNKEEEVFLLGINRKVIKRPNNRTYVLGDRKWTGQAEMIAAIKNDPLVYESIIKELRRIDLDGSYGETIVGSATMDDVEAEESLAE